SAAVSRNFCDEFSLPHVRKNSLQNSRPQPQQLHPGSGHIGRRMAQQPPLLLGLGSYGIFLVGGRHLLLHTALLIPAGVRVGYEEAEGPSPENVGSEAANPNGISEIAHSRLYSSACAKLRKLSSIHPLHLPRGGAWSAPVLLVFLLFDSAGNSLLRG